ncbi:MAG TPA: glycosyltransferase [Candidatus Limnocylindrales bacterium]|nr:glycosyltransferase [Candidatus Limnocylindrales bacterium]
MTAQPRARLRVMYPAALFPGGSERQMLLLARHLPADRFGVSFVVLGENTPLADEARRLGATVHVLGSPRRAGTPTTLFAARVSRRVLAFVALCRRERFDIADAWLFMGYGLVGVTRPLTRIPSFVSGRRSLSRFKERFGPAERVVDAIARRSSDAIVANSEAVRRDVARREGISEDRIRVIRNGVELPAPTTPASIAAARATLGLPLEGLIVGTVGMLKAGKGQDRVVRAFAASGAAADGGLLVLVGEGPERPALEALVASLGLSGRVRLVGLVEDARALYPAFDVVVSASSAEGLPNAVLEAAASGLAIVATDAGGTREVITDGDSGRLVGVDDDDALAAALRQLVRDPQARRMLGAAARQRAARDYGVDRFAAETAALYEELARAKGRVPDGVTR